MSISDISHTHDCMQVPHRWGEHISDKRRSLSNRGHQLCAWGSRAPGGPDRCSHQLGQQWRSGLQQQGPVCWDCLPVPEGMHPAEHAPAEETQMGQPWRWKWLGSMLGWAQRSSLYMPASQSACLVPEQPAKRCRLHYPWMAGVPGRSRVRLVLCMPAARGCGEHRVHHPAAGDPALHHGL